MNEKTKATVPFCSFDSLENRNYPELLKTSLLTFFSQRTTTGSQLFSCWTCLHTTTFILSSNFHTQERSIWKFERDHYPGMRSVRFRFPSDVPKTSPQQTWVSLARMAQAQAQRVVYKFRHVQPCMKIGRGQVKLFSVSHKTELASCHNSCVVLMTICYHVNCKITSFSYSS